MKSILIFLLVIISTDIIAQNVGVNNTNPVTSLDVQGALRLRRVDVTVTNNAVNLLPNYGNVRINGSPTADFAINDMTYMDAGQILVLTNSTLHNGIINEYTIRPGQTMSFVRDDDGYIPLDGFADWHRYGNYFTNPSNDFIGTMDPNDFVFKTNGSERARITSTGQVGIGTSSPLSWFDLSRTTGPSLARFNGGTQMYITLAENEINRGYLGSYTGGAEDVDFGTFISNPSGKVHLTTLSTPRLTVAADGKIGFGTQNPSTWFEVSQTFTGQLARFNGGTNMWITLAENGINRGYLGSFVGNAEDVEFGSYGGNSTGRVHLSTSNLARLTVEPGGNVGIGIGALTALSKLHIIGGTDADYSLSGNGYLMTGEYLGTNVVIDDNEILARGSAGASDLSVQRDGGNLLLCGLGQGSVGIGMTSTPVTKFQIVGGTDASLSSHGYLVTGNVSGNNMVLDNNEIMARNNGAGADLFIQHDGGHLILCGDEQGAVGIGLVNGASIPAGSLLAVDGKVTCEEVVVKLSQNWPDYVFAEDYKLTPIREVKTFIETHGHLPGLPDAASVEVQGLALGEMQRKMMEKIEELTLYIIQLEREMSALKEKIK